MTYPLSDSYCTRFNKHKPPIPYIPGQDFVIRSHDPPAPTTASLSLKFDGARERESKHPLERCLLHPPLQGSTGSTTMRVKILGTVRAGDGHSAQLVTIQAFYIDRKMINAPPSDVHLIAKFYDPLYFDHEQDDVDPFLCTDHDYSHETAVYKALCQFQGTIIPRFYGSYTCQLPIPGGKTSRSVRLILVENVPGISMQNLKPLDFTQSERQNILKAVVDAESLLYTHNVRHMDVHPRNILVLRSDDATLRVVLIDFGKSLIGRVHYRASPGEEQKYIPGVPISPLLRWNQAWWHDRQDFFDEWIDWDWQPWLEYHYGSTRASITPYMISIWLPSSLTESGPPTP
jgi:serine/threonine protein kinase